MLLRRGSGFGDSCEPLESEAMEKVWHLRLDFAFSSDGVLAANDLQPFSYENVSFRKAASRPGTFFGRRGGVLGDLDGCDVDVLHR